ncbi:MAG: hypothetical protein WDW38_011030 [Sanguina aurantia]
MQLLSLARLLRSSQATQEAVNEVQRSATTLLSRRVLASLQAQMKNLAALLQMLVPKLGSGQQSGDQASSDVRPSSRQFLQHPEQSSSPAHHDQLSPQHFPEPAHMSPRYTTAEADTFRRSVDAPQVMAHQPPEFGHSISTPSRHIRSQMLDLAETLQQQLHTAVSTLDAAQAQRFDSLTAALASGRAPSYLLPDSSQTGLDPSSMLLGCQTTPPTAGGAAPAQQGLVGQVTDPISCQPCPISRSRSHPVAGSHLPPGTAAPPSLTPHVTCDTLYQHTLSQHRQRLQQEQHPGTATLLSQSHAHRGAPVFAAAHRSEQADTPQSRPDAGSSRASSVGSLLPLPVVPAHTRKLDSVRRQSQLTVPNQQHIRNDHSETVKAGVQGFTAGPPQPENTEVAHEGHTAVTITRSSIEEREPKAADSTARRQQRLLQLYNELSASASQARR